MSNDIYRAARLLRQCQIYLARARENYESEGADALANEIDKLWDDAEKFITEMETGNDHSMG